MSENSELFNWDVPFSISIDRTRERLDFHGIGETERSQITPLFAGRFTSEVVTCRRRGQKLHEQKLHLVAMA